MSDLIIYDREDGSELTINVEYNQLDSLLKAKFNPEGKNTVLKQTNQPFRGCTC